MAGRIVCLFYQFRCITQTYTVLSVFLYELRMPCTRSYKSEIVQIDWGHCSLMFDLLEDASYNLHDIIEVVGENVVIVPLAAFDVLPHGRT